MSAIVTNCNVCEKVIIEPFATIQKTDNKIYFCSQRCFFEFSKNVTEKEVKEVKALYLNQSHCKEEKKA